nr:hypothetical protein [Myxococcaceae bacterium]
SDSLSAITASQSMMFTLTGFGNDFAGFFPSCSLAGAEDRVHRITIPAGFRLTASTTSTADHGLSLVGGPASNCAPLTGCLARADATFGGTPAVTETIRFDNASSMPRDVFLIVDRFGTSGSADYQLSIDLQTLPTQLAPAATCSATPPALPTNGTVASNTTGLMNNYTFGDTMGCQGQAASSAAPDGVFALTIPPNSRSTITSVASWDMVLNVVDSPDTNCGTGMGTGIACLGGSDTGATETVTVENTSMTASRTVFVLLDGWSTSDFGPVDITVVTAVIPPPAYTKTVTAQACDTFTAGATTVTTAIGDDVASTWAALPFAFNYFGAAVSSYSVSSNGLVGLSSLTTGNIETFAGNSSIPTTGTPNGMIAALWDDLNSVSPTSTVQAEAFGTAPNRRFVVGWSGVGFYDFSQPGSVTPHRLTFQVKLFEGTNVVEIHYCSLDANGATGGRETGTSATVGIENAAGTAGVQHSFNTLNSVNTTDALRFTP